ncbi:hypothetical protein L6452_34317 [Arctium lappa]|uniref:Uncharacterized protein n=1 Tax=Arctium lappa TaxID=4217 RepID=A0ACB8YIF1_ARCLA|nr:hypothetical protein L6452_34317 [Arctium lappa]
MRRIPACVGSNSSKRGQNQRLRCGCSSQKPLLIELQEANYFLLDYADGFDVLFGLSHIMLFLELNLLKY